MCEANGFFNGSTELARMLVNEGVMLQAAQDDLKEARAECAREIREIDGVKYRWDVENSVWVEMALATPKDAIQPDTITFFTLSGLVDYINENAEGLIPVDETRLILQVIDEGLVVLRSHPSQNEKNRYTIAGAKAHAPRIDFEKYMDTETFNTMLLSKFIDTPARQTLFGVVGSLTREQNCNAADDGVSQVLTVKQGVSMAANVTFRNPVPLKPMRTFTEVEQPESNFTLRVNDDALCALFESDGGAWKNEAVENIKAYLNANITNRNVVVMG